MKQKSDSVDRARNKDVVAALRDSVAGRGNITIEEFDRSWNVKIKDDEIIISNPKVFSDIVDSIEIGRCYSKIDGGVCLEMEFLDSEQKEGV